MRATELLPAPMIGKFASLARVINENVIPLVGISGGIVDGIKGSLLRSRTTPAPVPLAPNVTQSRAPSVSSDVNTSSLSLDDPVIVQDLRKEITTFMFAENLDGVSADAQLFMRKPRSLAWCSPSIVWSDVDFAVSLLLTIIRDHSRMWTIDTFHAEEDSMVGEKGKHWFDACWTKSRTSSSIANLTESPTLRPDAGQLFEYNSNIVKGGDHNLLMDPAFGASEAWLKRVQELVLTVPEV